METSYWFVSVVLPRILASVLSFLPDETSLPLFHPRSPKHCFHLRSPRYRHLTLYMTHDVCFHCLLVDCLFLFLVNALLCAKESAALVLMSIHRHLFIYFLKQDLISCCASHGFAVFFFRWSSIFRTWLFFRFPELFFGMDLQAKLKSRLSWEITFFRLALTSFLSWQCTFFWLGLFFGLKGWRKAAISRLELQLVTYSINARKNELKLYNERLGGVI